MPKSSRGLGRGLGALIPSSAWEPTTPGLLWVDAADIAPNPQQPRMYMDPEALQELADSIREHGLIQPLVVTQLRGDDDLPISYQLIAGERRWRACQLAGLQQIPVIVKEATQQEMLELALVENIQRADLNPLEEALAYQQLVDGFGLTQEQVAKKVGRNRVSVTNSLRLLRLPDEIKTLLVKGRLSEGHARALLALERVADQLLLAQQVQEKRWSVRQTEEAVRRLAAKAKKPARSSSSPETEALEESFRAALGTKVNLSRGRHGGKLTIYFYYDAIVEQSDQDAA